MYVRTYVRTYVCMHIYIYTQYMHMYSILWYGMLSNNIYIYIYTQEVLGVTFARDVPERLDIARDRVTTLTTR